ncbi:MULTISPECIES: hypothetical protein [unclassified Streptomyces]|uniref:hypothetical protein n=1 Tax=unclassified Streptomyces TaxID=2593676 RepID=UPI001F03461E|nr:MULTISPECIES: hypothetical protein [unclassified Streptomyces]MCH0566235.1 hypothetical protein [Streptomyces sp. MUM 2J]MCH0568402.1 hypothetical protein [Streptomyces sp. MUM 136J]
MDTLTPLPIRPAGPLRRAAAARVAVWLDRRRTAAETGEPTLGPGLEAALGGAAGGVQDLLPPPAPGGRSPGRLSAHGTRITGPVHGPAGYRRLMRRLLSEAATASPAARPVAIEYSVPAVDALVDARLDLIGGWEAKAMRSRAGIAGAHLLYDMLLRDLSSPRWAEAIDRGAPAPYLLWSTQPGAGPDRGADLAQRLLFPGTAVALSPRALEAFAQHGVVTGPTALDLAEALRVARVLDWFGLRLDALDVQRAP